MFQRLKGFNLDSFLDSKIAEEQAKQAKQSPSSPGLRRTSSNAGARKSGSRTESPNKRTSSKLRVPEGDSGTPAKSPDPEEFVIGDDASDVSRVATPRPVKEGADGATPDEKETDQSKMEKQEIVSSQDKGKEAVVDDELPEDVRKKLARLDSLTKKYQDLLRNYRTAHARVSSIEPFEATLREHTPLASIADPGALVEFLNQRSVQNEMVLQELKRISTENGGLVKERDVLKAKLDEAEKKLTSQETTGGKAELDPLGVQTIKPEQPTQTKATPAPIDTSDKTFFSYETELPRLEAELQRHKDEIKEHNEYINELSTENASLRQDLDVTRLDLSAMQNKIAIKDREINSIQSQLEEKNHEPETTAGAREEQQTQDAAPAESIGTANQELMDRVAAAEENLTKHQHQHEENLKNGTYVQREKKMTEIQQNVVKKLQDDMKQADASRTLAEGKVKELQFEIQKLESEANASEGIITKLRGHEDAATSLKKRLVDVESERDEAKRLAESKKGHEAAVASLRAQLKRAEKDRDAAYQMILDCGKCAIPAREDDRASEAPTDGSTRTPRSRGDSETTIRTEASTQPTEISAQSADGESVVGEPKKNKKKKSKAKKKDLNETAPSKGDDTGSPAAVPQPTMDELIEDPSKASELFSKRHDDKLFLEFVKKSMERIQLDRAKEDEDNTGLLRHHESVIEQRDQAIQENVRLIGEKDEEIAALQQKIQEKEAAIDRLDAKLKGEEDLREEIETLKESMLEAGSESTDAKHELKTLREQKAKLQAEFDDLEAESDRQRKTLKDAETQRDDLNNRCKTLETEITEVHNAKNATSIEQLRLSEEKLEASKRTRQALQLAKEASEKQVEDLKAQLDAHGADLGAKNQSLSKDLEQLKAQASTLEKDLAAANQLAQSRFKDLTDLRERLNKVQPELKRLREESEQLKKAKSDLEKSNSSVKRLEGKDKDLRSEIAEYKSQAVSKDGEVTSLKDKVKRADERSAALEDSYEKARKDLEQNERTRDEAVEARDKLQTKLRKAEDEVKSSKSRLEELEKQVNKFRDEASGLREEAQLKGAQQASAQSLMDSMQNQTRELATQMKEIKERNESLDEELAEAHRLLSERSREGETMRRLLADVEGRAESRVKDMREKMDLAIEERDRAEDESSAIGRRKAREIEGLKSNLQDAEREAARATEAREEAERRERDYRAREEGLQRTAAQAQEELNEVRAAMTQLRDSLDEGERQCRDLEKDRADLQRSLHERESRLEKLQKSSRAMAEELRSLQQHTAGKRPGTGTNSANAPPSSRSSVEAATRVASPAPSRVSSNGTAAAATAGAGKEGVDFVYLKNVLLQFLEQREKKHQMQLVPVLGMLLHFDRQDEQKWMAAISAKT